MRELFSVGEAQDDPASERAQLLLAFPEVKQRQSPCTAEWQDLVAQLGSAVGSGAHYKAAGEPKRRLWIVGTWTSWVPQCMRWHDGVYVYPVVIGCTRCESFQLLAGGCLDAAYYPSQTDASTWKRGWSIHGPDEHSRGKTWQIGKAKCERATPGSRFMVVAQVDTSGALVAVRWSVF